MATLGRYTLLDPIGEGGMAEVFRARLDGPMGFVKTLAIKRIREAIVRSEGDNVQALINEARIGGRLRHPNIVEVYELGEDQGAYYIAMEWVDGVTLARVLELCREQRWRLPANLVLDVAIQVARGLEYAHALRDDEGRDIGLVHRDLKPSNVMLSKDGIAKLMDFGISKSATNLFDTTATGIAKGTPLYMSPEQLRGVRPLPASSDLFSLGVLLHEMVSGRLLFAGRTLPEIITKVLNQPLEEPIAEANRLLPGVGPVLQRLLEREPADRFPGAKEAIQELQHLLDWQEKDLTIADLVQDAQFGRLPGVTPISTTEAVLRPIGEDAPLSPGSGDPRHELPQASDTLLGTFVRRRARTRWALLALLAAVVAGGAAALGYVVRGTYGVTLRVDAARAALEAGELDEALALWLQVLAENPARLDARFAAAALRSWAHEDTASIARTLEYAPEDEAPAFVAKYFAFGRVYREAGDYKESFRNLKIALDRAALGKGIAPPGALLWQAGEVALVLENADAARGYFRYAAKVLPDSPHRDAASAWADAIDEGRSGLLAAEIRWIDGERDEAWQRLPGAFALAETGREPRTTDRLVWAYRGLLEDRGEAVIALLDGLPSQLSREARRAVLTARVVVDAVVGAPAARRDLQNVLKLAASFDQRSTMRLLVADALHRAGRDPEWVGALIEDVKADAGDDDPEWVRVRDRATRKTAGRFARVLSLAWDPRTGRFMPAGPLRGGPGLGVLVQPEAFVHANVSGGGLPAPLGPAFHPIDDRGLPIFYHPGR